MATENEVVDQANDTSEAALDAAAEAPVTPAADEKTPDQKAEAAVGEKMKEIFGRNDAKNQKDELEEEGIEGPNNPDGDNPESKEEPVDEKLATEEEEVEEKLDEDGNPVAEPTAEDIERTKVLGEFDPNLKRVAAQLGGWKQQDIEDFIVSNPVLARVTFSNMAAGYNNLSLQYAQAARQGIAPTQQLQQAAATTQAQMSALDELLAKPEKLKALADTAGEELMKNFIKPLLDERKAAVEDRQFIAGLRREALVREINTSIEDLAKGGFEGFYGKTAETTQQQHDNRFKVGQVADQIRAGAQMQGVNMSIKDALNRAHLIVTADQVKAQVRKEITATVKRRATQITARPTTRATSSGQSGNRGDMAAIAAVEAFMSERGM